MKVEQVPETTPETTPNTEPTQPETTIEPQKRQHNKKRAMLVFIHFNDF